MTISTLSVSWFAGINPACVVLLRQLTRTDVALADDLAQQAFLRAYKKHPGVFAAKRAFPRGFTGSPTIVFREDARRRKELCGINEEQLKRNTILRRPILV